MNQKAIDILVAAYRKADADFEVAQSGAHGAFQYARIIGALQGSISNAAIELGYRFPLRVQEGA